jgi:hypothetical protein
MTRLNQRLAQFVRIQNRRRAASLISIRWSMTSSGLSQEVAGRSLLPGTVAYPTAGAGTSDLSPFDFQAALAASTIAPPASENRFAPCPNTGGVAPQAGPGGPARPNTIRD